VLTPHPGRRLLSALLLALLAACSQPANGNPGVEAGTAPDQVFDVNVRTLDLRRTPSRPLPTTVWYPAGVGRFPLVLLSHGLGGQPDGFTDLATSLASAGFVVAAPAYPFTKKHATTFDRNDVRNQPEDGAFVLDEVAKLDAQPDDIFAGRLETSRRCAAGFSAGGFTTSGMLTTHRDRRLRCGIVISAGAMDGGFSGPPVPVLFVHGDADKTVVYSRGHTAYHNLTWPKAFLTMHGQGHGEFLDGKRPGYPAVNATITDFLRWNLYGDKAARDRLPADGALSPLASFESSQIS
jgi:dienelactone hydrolase